MATETDEKLGTVKIADEVIAVTVAAATLNTNGVAGLSGGFTDNLSKNILGKESTTKGIKVTQNEEGILLDIYLIVKFGVSIPVVAWDVQSNVKKQVEHTIGEKVNAVNIHVQEVHINDMEEEETDDEK